MLTHRHSLAPESAANKVISETRPVAKGPPSIDTAAPLPINIAAMIDLLATGAFSRIAVAACVIAVLWLAVMWAIY
jgi:hypothetical protein